MANVFRKPMAYIRRSTRSRSDPGDISREFQIETVRALAKDDNDLTILDRDWGKSAATDETDKRLDFLAMLEAVEQNTVSTIYAYSTDRLARSVQWSARLLDACEKAGTTIVTSEGRFAPHDDLARQMFQFQAITNENYSRQAKRKRLATVARQRARGDKLGAPFYGALPGESRDAVREAYQRTGSLSRAARELNRIGVQSRRGHWSHSSVQRILARDGIVPPVGVRGAKHHHPHTFARLLRCHCGHLLTGSRRSGGRSLYRCIRAETDGSHGRKSITERVVLEWAVKEIGRLRPPDDLVTVYDFDAEHQELMARQERITRAFVAGLMDEPAMLQHKTELDEAFMQLDRQGRAVRVPPFEWNHEPRDLNLALRALWEYVEMDDELRPVRAQWLLPDSWLAPEAQQ